MFLFSTTFNQIGSTTSDDMNREFLKSYVGIDMPVRDNAVDVLDLPEEVFKNGDTINILRLNGLSPCIAWAMGAATGKHYCNIGLK